MQLNFENQRTIELPDRPADASANPGQQSLLQIGLANEVPLMHACGGAARCSTCRVLVLEGAEHLSPIADAEEQMIRRKGLEDGIRLACQARPTGTGSVRVRRLVVDDVDAEIALIGGATPSTGREQNIAVLFSDLRGFTPFAERMLPYDVIHILNRYFRRMGAAILANGGHIDKYMGDGIMAIFGLNQQESAAEPAEHVAAAVQAGLDMQAELSEFNRYLEAQFQHTFRMGIGVHSGAAIVGEIGHPRSLQFSALGDAVNVASRVEQACKRADADFLISEESYNLVRDRFRSGRRFSLGLKGKTGRHTLTEILGAAQPVDTVGGTIAPERQLERVQRELRALVLRQAAPKYLRLIFHDAASAGQYGGGLNGSVRFELDREDNQPLAEFAQGLLDLQARLAADGLVVSFADLLVGAGIAAVAVCEGPVIPFELGRQDVDAAAPPGFLPENDDDLPRLQERFAAMGLSMRDLVALSGAHTLGHYDGLPFTADPFTFNNSYFQRLALEDAKAEGDFCGEGGQSGELALLQTDNALLTRPETLAIVREYARDEARFFEDFVAAYTRMARGSL